jgi:hypothetical protein
MGELIEYGADLKLIILSIIGADISAKKIKLLINYVLNLK